MDILMTSTILCDISRVYHIPALLTASGFFMPELITPYIFADRMDLWMASTDSGITDRDGVFHARM